MAWPFTPITTFIAKSVPKVTAAFLNALQTIHNATFAPVYHRRPSIYVRSTNGSQVLVFAASLTVKDSVTSEYVYIEQIGRTVSTTWPTSTWRYLYLVSASGVASVEISSTGPTNPFFASPLFKDGDETRRYLCAVRCDSGGNVVAFNMIDGRYLWLDNNLVLAAGVGTAAWVPLDMSIFVPPHARRNILRTRITNAAGAVGGVAFRTFGVGTITVQVDANSYGERDLTLACNAATIEWFAAATITHDVLSRGWEE